jgi:3-oxoacyl-[acyl-carrier protein] reductase
MGSERTERVVITGGATGIGLAVAERVVSDGGEVCLVSRREDALRGASERLGARAWWHRCDVASADEVDRLRAAVTERWGALDGLVNSAGVAPMASLLETDLETWDLAFDVNVRAPFLLARALHPLLEAGTLPSVVSISSTLAEKAIPGMAAYNAAKAALNQLTRSMALEWAPTIRVNAVMPAVVDTPIHATRGLTPADVEAMGAIHPMQRIGRPEDVAAMVRFLLSKEAAWVTGAVLPVDGGMMAT